MVGGRDEDRSRRLKGVALPSGLTNKEIKLDSGGNGSVAED